jgi:hypothetical protein
MLTLDVLSCIHVKMKLKRRSGKVTNSAGLFTSGERKTLARSLKFINNRVAVVHGEVRSGRSKKKTSK